MVTFLQQAIFFQIVFCFQLLFARLSNLESENLELNQQVGELGRALGQEAAAYQAQVLIVLIPRCTNLAVFLQWGNRQKI